MPNPNWTRYRVPQDIDDPVSFNEHGLRISAEVLQLQSTNDWSEQW